MQSLRSFFITFLIALLLFGLCAYIVIGLVTDTVSDLLSGDNVTEPHSTTESTPAETITLPVGDDPEEIEGESFNILLIGTDYRPSLFSDYHPDIDTQYPTFTETALLTGVNGTLPEHPFRTVGADAVVLVCVNKEKQSFTYMQIPACMQLNIGGENTTVRDLYYAKGLEYFVNKMSNLTGVGIDYYAVTGIEQVANVVNELGSVTYTVPCDMEYTDEISGLSISLAAGAQKLDGAGAAALLSFTTYEDPSLSRDKTALSFLKTVAMKMTNVTYMNRAASIFKNASEYVYTNFTAEDLTANLDLIFHYGSFSIHTVDYPGNYFYSNGERLFNPNTTSAVAAMAKYQ